jgi:hypothetical protein
MRTILTEAKEECVHGHRIDFKEHTGYKIGAKSDDNHWYNSVIERRHFYIIFVFYFMCEYME